MYLTLLAFILSAIYSGCNHEANNDYLNQNYFYYCDENEFVTLRLDDIKLYIGPFHQEYIGSVQFCQELYTGQLDLTSFQLVVYQRVEPFVFLPLALGVDSDEFKEGFDFFFGNVLAPELPIDFRHTAESVEIFDYLKIDDITVDSIFFQDLYGIYFGVYFQDDDQKLTYLIDDLNPAENDGW